MATLPNFLIIGAAKCGTTALFEYLEQHPEVFLCDPKEPNYLALGEERPTFRGPGDDVTINANSIVGWSRYQKLFSRAGNAKAIGEASVSTLYFPESIERIHTHLPNAKIICMLRQPAERAYSAFSFMHMRAFEPCQQFTEALADEPRRIAERWHHIWHYRGMSNYHQQLLPYYNAFGRDRMRVYLFDDFKANPAAILRDCFQFLEIDPEFIPSQEPSPHVSGMPKSRLLQSLYSRARWARALLRSVVPKSMKRNLQKRFAKMNLERVPLDPQLRAELTDSFRTDILRLQDLLDRDLSVWLAEKPAKQSNEPAHALR